MKKRGLPYLDAAVGDIITIYMDTHRQALVKKIIQAGTSHSHGHFYEVDIYYGDRTRSHTVFRGEVLDVFSSRIDELVLL